MDVAILEEPDEVAQAAQDFLRRDPFTSNVIAVQLETQLRSPSLGWKSIWAIARRNSEVVGVAMRTPPHPIFVPRMEREVARALAEVFAEAEPEAPGVNGEIATTGSFAAEWQRLTGRGSRQRTAMRMYALEKLRPPTLVRGSARPAIAADIELVTSWLYAFHDEAQPGTPANDFRKLAERRIAQGDFWLWTDDGSVSLAAVSPPANGVARVGPVYTPPASRRNGFGAAVTASATRAALGGGATHVVLYTDLANPTSNSIYQSIGYVAHHDAEERDFDG